MTDSDDEVGPTPPPAGATANESDDDVGPAPPPADDAEANAAAGGGNDDHDEAVGPAPPPKAKKRKVG